MKPASIIFLIVAAVLIIGGFVVFQVGASIARGEDVEIFSQQRNEDRDYVYSREIEDGGENGVRRLLFNLTGEADVYIYGGAEENSIELVNFSEGRYNVDDTNQTLAVDDSFNVMKMFELGKSGFNFDGLRNYFRNISFGGRPRRVNIYVKDYSNIKIYEIHLNSGNIFIENLKSNSDCVITVENGNVTIDGYRSTSDMKIEVLSGDVTVSGSYSRNVSVAVGTGTFTSRIFSAAISYKAELGSGEMSFTLTNPGGEFEANLTARTEGGDVTAFGAPSGTEYEMISEDDFGGVVYELYTAEGNIIIG